MPPPPLFSSESGRRLAVAVLMLVLLAGAMGLAVWLSLARGPEARLEAVTQALGPFRFIRPASWTKIRISRAPSVPIVGYHDPRRPRWLIARVRPYAQSLDPKMVLKHVLNAKIQRGRFKIYRTQEIQVGPLVGLYAIGTAPAPERIPRKHLLVILTPDRRQYLVLSLRGKEPLTARDIALIRMIAQSTRYVGSEASQEEEEQAHAVLPSDMRAWKEVMPHLHASPQRWRRRMRKQGA